MSGLVVTKRIDVRPVLGDNGLDACARAIEKATYFVRDRQNRERINGRAWYIKDYTVGMCGGSAGVHWLDVTVRFTNEPDYAPPKSEPDNKPSLFEG